MIVRDQNPVSGPLSVLADRLQALINQGRGDDKTVNTIAASNLLEEFLGSDDFMGLDLAQRRNQAIVQACRAFSSALFDGTRIQLAGLDQLIRLHQLVQSKIVSTRDQVRDRIWTNYVVAEARRAIRSALATGKENGRIVLYALDGASAKDVFLADIPIDQVSCQEFLFDPGSYCAYRCGFCEPDSGFLLHFLGKSEDDSVSSKNWNCHPVGRWGKFMQPDMAKQVAYELAALEKARAKAVAFVKRMQDVYAVATDLKKSKSDSHFAAEVARLQQYTSADTAPWMDMIGLTAWVHDGEGLVGSLSERLNPKPKKAK